MIGMSTPTASMPTLSPHGAILPGGTGATTRGTGTTDGAGTSVGVASASDGDGATRGITTIIITIPTGDTTTTIIMVPSGPEVADTSVADGATDSTTTTVVARPTAPMQCVATVAMTTVCVPLVATTVVQWLRVAIHHQAAPRDVWWPDVIRTMPCVQQVAVVETRSVMPFRQADVPAVIR